MMRVVRAKNGEAVPQFICDVCQKPITDIGMAMGAWLSDLDEPGQTSELRIFHKRECDRIQLARLGPCSGWHELRHILQLMKKHLDS